MLLWHHTACVTLTSDHLKHEMHGVSQCSPVPPRYVLHVNVSMKKWNCLLFSCVCDPDWSLEVSAVRMVEFFDIKANIKIKDQILASILISFHLDLFCYKKH